MKKKIAILACGWYEDFIRSFLDGLKSAAKDTETDFYLFNCYDFVEFSGFPNYTGFSIYRLINYEEYDGIIILSDLIRNQRVLEKERLRILQSKKPAICVNQEIKDIPCIHVDNYTGFYELINHLIVDHNVKDLAYIGGRESSVDVSERYKAYRIALQDNQIAININKIYTIPQSNFSDAYEFATNYFENGESLPEAIVCATDYIALGVLKAAQEHNIKIPEQLKIIGCDNTLYDGILSDFLSSASSNFEELGFEVYNQLVRLAKGETLTEQDKKPEKLKSKAVIRKSCGCNQSSDADLTQIRLNLLADYDKTQSFSRQMETLDDIFTEATDVFTLLTNLEHHFNKSHVFEGNDFCLFLKADWSSVLINSEENLPQNLSYGDQVQAIASIQGGKKYPREIIGTKELMPTKMKTSSPAASSASSSSGSRNNVFIFLPIFNHSYVHGYFVCKNSTRMLTHLYGYNWTRTIGNAIERFRKRNMFKQMSQQFLRLSTKDALSGMLNRVGLEKLAIPFYEQNKKMGITSILFFVDINSMKTINDKFGHLHGDLAVKTISAAVLETVPKNWMCVRYGGDEFLVVGNSKGYNGEDYCTMIRQCVQKKTATMRLPYNLSASVGTYTVPANSPLSLEQAVEKVDEIMYAQKQAYHQAMGDRH